MYAASFKTQNSARKRTHTHTHTHGRARVSIDKFIQMFACISYLLNQYFKLSNSRNLKDAKHPRDLLSTITSRFAQHSHLLVSARHKAPDMHTTAVTAWPLQSTRYIRQLQKNILCVHPISTLHYFVHWRQAVSAFSKSQPVLICLFNAR